MRRLRDVNNAHDDLRALDTETRTRFGIKYILVDLESEESYNILLKQVCLHSSPKHCYNWLLIYMFDILIYSLQIIFSFKVDYFFTIMSYDALVYYLKVGSLGKINRILQIIYYSCSIRNHRPQLAINPILFFYIKITFPPKQNNSH